MSSSNPEIKKELQKFDASDLDVDRILKEALKNGGAVSELFFESIDATLVSYENQKVDKILDGGDRGVGLRVIFENRSVYGYTTDLSNSSVLALAARLAEAVKSGAPGLKPFEGAIDWRRTEQKVRNIADYRVKNSPRELLLEDKIGFAKRIDQGARKELSDARQVTAMIRDSYRKILVLNSDGMISPDTKTYLHMIAQVVGQKGERVEMAYDQWGGYIGTELFDQTPPEQIGGNAARRVKILLDAKPAPAGTMPVVMSAEAGGTMVHEAVGHGLEADLACNGLSVYEGKLGKDVASPIVSVVDDGTIEEYRGSYAFDDEGTPSKKNVLIENGKLKSYMVDRLSAMKFDLMATGNGRRESFRHKPIVRMTNTYIESGKDDPAKVLEDTKKGVFVKAMGGGQVNTVTGDFVFAVTEGYLIHDGKLGDPIRGATLVGNGPRVLTIIDRVGNDMGFATGTCGKDAQAAPVTDGQPTLRIPELTVGGEAPMSDYWKD